MTERVERADEVHADDGLERRQRVRAALVRDALRPADARAADGDAELEVWGARRKAKLLERVLRRQVTIDIAREEGYAFFVVPALVLLVLALALPERKRRASR